MTRKNLYELTPEHHAQLKPWADQWIANAMSTAAMTDEDKKACCAAVFGLYAAAELPPPKHIVFVSSPFVLAFAAGFAASIWYRLKSKDATWDATRDATWAATGDATRAATWAATGDATWDDLSKWYFVPADMRALAHEIGVGNFGLSCAANTWNIWNYGNQDSGYDAFLSFFQDIAQLPLDYGNYKHWRVLAERSGPRVMHADFCMISDRPRILKVDADNRPHCDEGPFCAWRDGSALFSIHGTRLPAKVVLFPDRLTAEEVRDERNAEIRRHMLDRYAGLRGSAAAGKWLSDIGAAPISEVDITSKMQSSGLATWKLSNGDAPVLCKLYRAELPDDEPLNLLFVVCTSTAKEVFLRVPPNIHSAAEARDWTFGGVDLALAVET